MNMPKRKNPFDGYRSKRARSSSTFGAVPGTRTYKALRRSASAIRAMVVPGYTRSAGYYGRFSRSGIGAEKKFFDTTLNFSFDATGEVPATGQLTLIPQGDTESTRDGRKAVIESVQIRANLTFTPGAGATASCVTNMWLVLDTQCNGAAAAWDDVFSGTGVSGTGVMLNLNNSGRFRILKHWTWNWNPGSGATTAFNTVSKQLEFYKKCNIPVDWSSTTGALTEIRSNNLFLLAGSSNADDLVSLGGTCRLRFRG